MPQLYGPFFGDESPLNLPPVAAPSIMPQQQQAPQGFLGRLGNAIANPGPLGQMGAYLMAASGAPLGHALIGMQQYRLQEKLQEEERAAKQEAVRQQQERLRLEQESLDLRRTVANKPPAPTSLARNLMDAGYTPGTPEFQSALREAILKPEVSITNVGETAKEKKAGEAVGTAYGDIFSKSVAGADAAREQNLQLAQLDYLANQVNFQGPGAEAFLTIKKAATAFGVDPESLGITDDTAPAQAFKALSNQLALRLRNPESGLGLTGNTSDRDITFLKSLVPQLTNTAGGNKLIIDIWRKVNNRRIEEAGLAQDFEQRYGVTGKDPQGRTLQQHLTNFNDKRPLFTDEEQSRYQEQAQQGAYSPEDLEFTAKKHGITVDEVKRRLGIE